MGKSGNYIHDYAYSLFGKDFQTKPLYWCVFLSMNMNCISNQQAVMFYHFYASTQIAAQINRFQNLVSY